MNPRVLLILTRDPRTDARALEGIRLAAGVGTWQRLDLRVFLDGQALRAFEPEVEELEEGDDYVRYLRVLADAQLPVHVPLGTTLTEGHGVKLQSISTAQLAQLAAESNYVVRF
jgi:hypothetical protein